MLLPQKANAIEYLARSRPSRLQTLLQLGVFSLQLLHSLRAYSRTARGRVDRLHSRLRLKRAAAETRQLVSKVSNELLELAERRCVRTFVV
jgi:hypothetical protein